MNWAVDGRLSSMTYYDEGSGRDRGNEPLIRSFLAFPGCLVGSYHCRATLPYQDIFIVPLVMDYRHFGFSGIWQLSWRFDIKSEDTQNFNLALVFSSCCLSHVWVSIRKFPSDQEITSGCLNYVESEHTEMHPPVSFAVTQL